MKNLNNDVIAVYNSTGTKLVSYTYDAWGNFTLSYHNGATSSSVAVAIVVSYYAGGTVGSFQDLVPA